MCLVEKHAMILYPLRLFGNKVRHSKGFENGGIKGSDCLAFRHVISLERHLCQIRGKMSLFNAVKNNRSTYSFMIKWQILYLIVQTKHKAILV